MANTIVIKGLPIRTEGIAGGAITPGHLIEIDEAGSTAGDFLSHRTSDGAAAAARFALENSVVGAEIGTAYASGDTVQSAVFRKGDVVNALLATSETIVKGDLLSSEGNGQLQGSTVTNPIARAAESVTTGGTVARILAEIL